MNTDPFKECKTCGRTYSNVNDFLSGTNRWRVCERGNLWYNCSCHSTHMIIKGRFPWYSPDMFMSKKAKSVFNTLPSLQELPHIPAAIMELQQLITDENISAGQLARASRKDPLIAANILKIAQNLKESGKTPQIESLEHAISYIGINRLSEVALTASIKGFPFKSRVFESDQFWEECFLTGRIAEKLTQEFGLSLVPDEVYIAGTLANVGKVVLAICFPEQADKIAEDCRNRKVLSSWRGGEKNHRAQDHSVLGEIAASFWGLPEYVLNSASSHHHVPDHTTQREKDDIEIDDVVRLANQLSHWVRLEPTKIEQPVLDSCMKTFGLNEHSVDRLAEGLLNLRM